MEEKRRFSSRQITTIITVVALAAIFIPRAVEAATGSSVNITDPSTATRKARVTAGKTLATGVCDPFLTIGTTTCARVAGGKLKVGDGSGALTVDGAVATDVPPGLPLQEILVINDTTSDTFQTTPFGQFEGVAVTSITAANIGTVALNLRVIAHVAPVVGGVPTCNGTGVSLQDIEIIAVPAGATVHVAFPQPIVTPDTDPGATGWCLDAGPFLVNSAGSDVRLTIVGYVI